MQTDALLLSLFNNTDERIRQNKSVTPAFLYAGLLWYPLQEIFHQYKAQGFRPAPAMDKSITDIIEQQNNITAIPKKFTHTMREIWMLQYPFESRLRPFKLLHQIRFRAAYDFLLLRACAEKKLEPIATWWTTFIDANEKLRHQMIHELPKKPNRRKKKKPVKPSASADEKQP